MTATKRKKDTDTADKKPIGRPSSYTPEIADKICERLIEGESLRSICRAEDMPSAAAVCRWLGQFETFREQYARAREAQADTLADEIMDISDDGRNDWMERANKDGELIAWQVNGEAVQRSRLRVDARKWLASKMAPKKYGEKIQSEVTGANGAPFVVQIVKFGETDAQDSDPQ
ncbi:MAG TPA: terminase small subunit protein [Candidatus Paceibacterota bacterium]